MMKYRTDTIASLIGAHRYGEVDTDIEWLLTDSRSLCFPESTLFFALVTARNDGHRYIDELYNRGVRNFVVSTLPQNMRLLYAEANFLKVDDTLVALQRLAERHREAFDIPVVGITGSNGKTVVKEWLYQLLSHRMNVTRSPRSFNSQVGVPLSLWHIDSRSQVALIEAGISMPGEMRALRDMIQPSLCVLTNIGAPHQENFESLRQKCLEKLALAKDAEALVYCDDDEVVREAIDDIGFKGKRLAWSLTGRNATLKVLNVEKGDDHTDISYSYQSMEGRFSIPFIDDASVANAISCALVAFQLGCSAEYVAKYSMTLEPVAMRLEVKVGRNGCTIINDSYNSDIHSLDIALDFARRRPDHDGKRRTLVISDIRQSGMSLDDLYRTVSELAVKRGVDKLIGIGPDISSRRHLLQVGECYFFNDTDEFVASRAFDDMHDEVVLLKGAREFAFDRLTEMLVYKVHETTLEVNLNAVVANLNYFKSFLKPSTKIVCMVKADAYGAGAVEIAKTLQEHHVDYLAVAVADEGATLRRNGITANIMVMNPEMSAFKTMFDYRLEPEVYSFRLLDALVQAAEKEGIMGYPVHVKLDTGMHRLGFDPAGDMDLLVERLSRQTALVPRSVFSHFVGSDSDGFDEFSSLQYKRFIDGSDRLQKAFSHHILRHIDNSAGIEHFPERQLDMCRLGLGLYGVSSRDNRILNTVSTLKTTILQLRHVPKEDTVGYSRKGVLERDSVIAAIPIGYADGLNRGLGRGRCYCLVNGQKAPYVGNICMDVAMVDVTGIECREGDTVEVFGDHLPVTVLSDCLDTIPYEVFTAISNRVKRVYFQD